jgi:integration host factor subunit beta
MVKSELVHVLSEKLPALQQSNVELAVNCMIKQMVDALAQGERIEIRGFGVFAIRHRLPRIGRNPKSGEIINVGAKVALHFKPGKVMKDRVNAVYGKCRITD